MTRNTCKHDKGFRFYACTAADRLPGVWVCECFCGFSLNFDPEEFQSSIAYLEYPNPELVCKTIVIPSHNGKGQTMNKQTIIAEVCAKYDTNMHLLRWTKYSNRSRVARNSANAVGEMCYRLFTELHMSLREIGNVLCIYRGSVSTRIKRHCDLHKLPDPILQKSTEMLDNLCEEARGSNDPELTLKVVIKAYKLGYHRGYNKAARAKLVSPQNRPVPEYLISK